jgi:uncharacterized protein
MSVPEQKRGSHMADYDRRLAAVQSGTGSRTDDVTYDAGLRSFMLGVYNYMAAGVALTGAASYGLYAYAASNPDVFAAIYQGPMRLVIMFAPLVYGFYLIYRMNSMSVAGARNGFFLYATLVGLSLSFLFAVYSGQSIARVFFISAAMFAGTSAWGYTTKRDLTGFGSFLIMGLIGIIIASLVNLFFASSQLQWMISVLGVFIFAGLTAYDTQKLKDVYETVSGDATAIGRATVGGALTLYLDFINLFIMLMRLMGDRR